MERFFLELPARVSVITKNQATETIDLLTSNVCAGGAFFHTDRPLPVGAGVKIDLILSMEKLKDMKAGKAFIKLSGTVIGADRKSMAICFDEDFKISPLQNRNPGR